MIGDLLELLLTHSEEIFNAPNFIKDILGYVDQRLFPMSELPIVVLAGTTPYYFQKAAEDSEPSPWFQHLFKNTRTGYNETVKEGLLQQS